MKKIFLIIVCLISIPTLLFHGRVNAQRVFDYNGITYKVIKDADEAPTFGTVAVTAKSNGFYEGVITVPGGVKQSDDEYADAYKVVAIDDYAFKGNPMLTKVVLPITVESIGNGAFEECKELTAVEIPYGSLLTHLGESVFAFTGLKSIKFPEGITELPRFTFRECRKLEQVSLPESLAKIGISAFIYCQSLKSIELPKGLREIEISAFGCCGLKSISLPDRVVCISMGAFGGCYDLEEVVRSPYTTTIKTGAFSSCYHLKKINKPETLINVDNGSFNGCIYLPDYYQEYMFDYDVKMLNIQGDKYREKIEEQCQELKKSMWK